MNFVGRRSILRGSPLKSLGVTENFNSGQHNRIVRLKTTHRKDFPGLDIVTENLIQTIKFNRPEKKNALTTEMYDNLASLLKEAENDEGVAVTVLTGAGNVYSSGQEFGASLPKDIETHMDKVMDSFQKFIATFIDYPKLMVAVVNGPAIGVAATTMALCDLVYASDKAWFSTPFARLGLAPEGCSSYTFPRIMGRLQAARLLYLCDTLTAEEAQQCGLVTQVFPGDQLQVEAYSRISSYTELPLQSTRTIKQLVRGWDRDTLHRVNQEEIQVLKKMVRSKDFHTAMAKFSNKKKK